MLVFKEGDIEKMCTCYGNALSEAYAKNPRPDFTYLRKLGAPLLAQCIIAERGPNYRP